MTTNPLDRLPSERHGHSCAQELYFRHFARDGDFHRCCRSCLGRAAKLLLQVSSNPTSLGVVCHTGKE